MITTAVIAAVSIVVAVLAAVAVAVRRRGERNPDSGDDIQVLIGGLAHEIRNPLNSINANLQLLQEDISADEGIPNKDAYLDRVEKTRSEIQRLNTILNDFLRYMRLPEPDLIETDIAAVVAEILDFIEPESNRLHIRIVRDVQDTPPVMIDPSQIKQSLLNLILNAHGAMPDGGELRVSVKSEGKYVRIDITDNGSGIPEEILEKIFDPFFSTKGTGTGLGLTLVKHVIEKHGGRIEVKSKEGMGTTVSLFLPTE